MCPREFKEGLLFVLENPEVVVWENQNDGPVTPFRTCGSLDAD